MARLKGKDEEIKGNLEQKYWVQKSDPLVLMRSVPFSLGELKVLDTYISRINAADESRTTVIFTKEEYEELMGISKINAEVLKKHADGLLGKIVTLEMPDKSFLKFVLFTAAYYHLDDCGVPIIELSCSPQAKDLFFCIGKYHYFKYALENVINLTHKASYLLYIYILHNRYRGEWELSLDELRDSVLDYKGQYQEYKVFKRDVLDVAVKEINKKTDCHFVYEAIKRGRKVAKIKFIYHSQDELEGQTSFFDEAYNVPLLSDQHEDDALVGQTDMFMDEIDYGSELADLLGSSACNDEFSPEQVRVLQDLVLKAVPQNDNIARCNYLIEQVHRMNIFKPSKRFAYLCKMIRNDIKEE